LNARVNRLSHSLLSLGLEKGDKVAVLLENCIEIVEAYLATAKTGLIIVPINFRLVGAEIEYILDHSDAKAVIVHDEFTPTIDKIKPNLKNIREDRYFVVGERTDGYSAYDDLIEGGDPGEPTVTLEPRDTWILLYTSGTTGRPKGVVRSHESYVAFYLINAIDFGFTEHDNCLNVLPLCHVNSTFFTLTFTYIGASVYIHPARSFRPEEILEIIQREGITFISLVPTHYNLIFNAPEEVRRFDVGSVKKLLCSSAPATRKIKKGILEFFPGVQLYEGYGSTEAGIVTVLKPEDQLRKLGSIGYESLGTDYVKILDEEGNELSVGEVGELYSRGPMLFDEYYKNPELTGKAFKGEWFSAGDMAKEDEDGFFYLVDRKDNMIITGGENVYPSEVEEVVCTHPCVFDAAIIGIPDDKWGEMVIAVVIVKAESDEKSLIDFCRDKIAGYKRPKKVIFIKQEEMPRTATGKILHRLLRERYSPKKD
jgi:acyl-CoA synthetase (AMP-forming)/AMP-acid ligase II